MNSLKYIFIALLVFTVFAAAQTDQEKTFHYFAPSKFGNSANIEVSGKAREYYLLNASSQIEFPITGPCQLKVVSRLGLNNSDQLVHYRFFAKRDNQEQNLVFEEQAKAVDTAKLVEAPNSFIGAADENVIDIPRGDHNYKFFLPKGSQDKIYLRFASNWVDSTELAKKIKMTPVDISTKVEMLSGDKPSTYYRVGHGEKLILKVIGPVSLKGFCRIEFDSTMTGEQKWRLQVLEDGKMKATYPMTARKSQIVFYKEPSKMVPSHAQTFFVEIPEGEHVYEFDLPESNRTALVKFSVYKTEQGSSE